MRKTTARKLNILILINERGTTTTRYLATKMRISLTNVSRLLGHYWHQGLLVREPSGGGRRGGFRYNYSLSESGKKRLNYLRRRV